MDAATVRLPDGVTLPYVVQGDADGTPVVLLHAVGESWRSFGRLLPLLPSAIRAYAVTQRGHGAADKPPSGYDLGVCARDVAGFMSAVGLDRAVLIGASSGGYVAQRFAAEHPDRTAGLVLVGSPRSLRGLPVPAWVDEAAGLTDPVPESFVRESITSFAVGRTLPSDFVDEMVDDGMQCPAHVWRATMRGLLDAPPQRVGSDQRAHHRDLGGARRGHPARRSGGARRRGPRSGARGL